MLHSGAATIQGKIGHKTVEMILDSGSSVSVLCEDILKQVPQYCRIPPRRIQFISAAGEHIPVIDHVSILVNRNDRQIEQPFVVVGALIVPVILGLDFDIFLSVLFFILYRYLSIYIISLLLVYSCFSRIPSLLLLIFQIHKLPHG